MPRWSRAALEDVDLPAFKKEAGPIDLLLASPECRNHTCARGAAPRDEASRATALMTVDYARAFTPRWLVLENVIHMRPWSRYDELKRSLRDLDYRLKEHVLVASEFGVPQARRRLFLVGDLKRSPKLAPRGVDDQKPSVRSILDDRGTWKTSPLFSPKRAKATLARARRAVKALGKRASFLIVYYGSDGRRGMAGSRPSAPHDHDGRPLRPCRARRPQVDDPHAASSGTQARNGARGRLQAAHRHPP